MTEHALSTSHVFETSFSNLSISGDRQQHIKKADESKHRPKLVGDVVDILLRNIVEDAREKEESITSYLLVSREYVESLLTIVYKSIYITDRRRLSLLRDTVVSNPALARRVKALSISTPLVPFAILQPVYNEQEHRGIPVLIAEVILVVSPTLRALCLKVPVHPRLIHTFRTCAFPELRSLDTFHPFLLDLRTTIWIYNRLSDWYQSQYDANANFWPDQPSLTEPDMPVLPWPVLHRLTVRFDGSMPEFSNSSIDMRRMHSVQELIIRLWRFENWEFNVQRFLIYIQPPSNAEVAALMLSSVTSHPIENYTMLFSPIMVIPTATNALADLSLTEDPSAPTDILLFASPYQLRSKKFWRKARRHILYRNVDGSPFLPFGVDHIMSLRRKEA